MALNNVDLQGRLCKEIKLENTNNGGTYLRNTIACQRNYVRQGEERQSDFVSIVAYGKTAEHISKFFDKGSEILINGEIRTGSYEKDGNKVYTTDVIVNKVYFCGSKVKPQNDLQYEASLSNIPSVDADSSDLPF